MSYYLTWPVVLLGFVGFAIAAWRLGRGGAPWAVLLGGLLVPSLLYVIRPAIMPDQIWAIRRLTPSLVVGLLILAAVAWQALLARWRRRGYDRAGWPRVASIALAGLIAAAPLAGWVRVTSTDGLSILSPRAPSTLRNSAGPASRLTPCAPTSTGVRWFSSEPRRTSAPFGLRAEPR